MSILKYNKVYENQGMVYLSVNEGKDKDKDKDKIKGKQSKAKSSFLNGSQKCCGYHGWRASEKGFLDVSANYNSFFCIILLSINIFWWPHSSIQSHRFLKNYVSWYTQNPYKAWFLSHPVLIRSWIGWLPEGGHSNYTLQANGSLACCWRKDSNSGLSYEFYHKKALSFQVSLLIKVSHIN